MDFTLKSSVFEPDTEIPQRYTGEGADLSPPLMWVGAPDGTKEFALICEDPDAPGTESFVHWMIYNIPHNVISLPEGVPKMARLTDPIGVCQGMNTAGEVGYMGPMPPIGHGMHRYVFTLFALDEEMFLKPSLTRGEVLADIHDHVLSKTQLIGHYERSEERRTAA